MSNLSLLVDCHKIINWLEDRKKLHKDWYNYVKAAEQKMKVLLKESEWFVKYPQITQFIRQEEDTFHYCDVIALVELILQTDMANDKNMLFGYNDKRVKQWITLKKYMEGKSIGLLNTAKFIHQVLSFDLVGINKNIEIMDNQLANLKRKIDFNQNTIYQQNQQITKEKLSLGLDLQLETQQVQNLIPLLIKQAPKQFEFLVQSMRNENIRNYINIYNQINRLNATENWLVVLEYIINNGDQYVEIYQKKTPTQKYQYLLRYQQFINWNPQNEWGIEIDGKIMNFKSQSINMTTILQHLQTRQQLLYELNQILYFFKGLKFQMSNASKGLAFQSQNFKKINMVEGEVDQAIATFTQLISFINSKKFTTPIELKNSTKAYQLFVNHFKSFEANISTMKEQIKNYKQQIEELDISRQLEVKKLIKLRSKAVVSKNYCQKWMSQLIKKEIKITGEVNKFQ